MYFRFFPIIPYDSVGDLQYKDVTNLLRRVGLRAKLKSNTALYDTYSVKEGDVIEVRDKSKEMVLIVEALALKERDVPEYIEVDFKKMTAKFKRIPELSDVPYPAIMEPNLVVEYYAKN